MVNNKSTPSSINGKLIGYWGTTGRSTGNHLHLEAAVQRPGQKDFTSIDPGQIKSQLRNFYTVGPDGKELPLVVESAPRKLDWNSAYRISSPRGMRDSRYHNGIDFVGEAFETGGAPWYVKDSANVIGFKPGVDDPGGYGNNAFVTTRGDDGSIYRFTKAHLQSTPNTWTNPNFGQSVATESPAMDTPAIPAMPTAQKTGENTTVNFSISLEKKKEEDEENFLSQYINKMFLSAMMPQDYTKMASSIPNYYSDLG